MKRITFVTAVAVLALVRLAQADFVQTYNTGFQNGGVIPDGSLTGWSDTRTVSASPGLITDVSVSLNLSGGWNGDLYAYLVHSSGFAVLLNRVGVDGINSAGYGNAGMNVVLNDAGALGNIHFYGGAGVPTGTYQPDGRNVNPLSSGAIISGTTPTALLSSFNGLNPNGNWTLFIADVSGGDQITVGTWTLSMNIAAVPEPRSIVEGGIAALFMGVLVGLYRLRTVTSSLRPA